MFQIQASTPVEGEIDLSAEGLTATVAARTKRKDLVAKSMSRASAFAMKARLADSYRVGRLFLVVDATHPPSAGQGLNTNVQDAYNLAGYWQLC